MAVPPLLAAERGAASALQELEVEAIEMFINFLRLIGLPKSVGEIYGLLFVAPRPMAMDDIMDRLGISLGAASQGLKLLRSFGAVRVVYERGERRDHYVADLELSRFATVFIKEELQPRMDMAADPPCRPKSAKPPANASSGSSTGWIKDASSCLGSSGS